MSSTETREITVKGGLGRTYGVVSEATAFFTIKPGHADELRAALGRFQARVANAPWDYVVKFGIVDLRSAIFDDDTRMMWQTSFDTDFVPYVDDSVATMGWDTWSDWIQHLEEAADYPVSTGKDVRDLIQMVQTTATTFWRAVSDMTLEQTRQAREARAALDAVIDTPGGPEALQAHPELQPLLDQAAS
jgi:hypothetical protein